MSLELPESPLPAPIPYAKPTLVKVSFIQLKSLKFERDRKKSQTTRCPARKSPTKTEKKILELKDYKTINFGLKKNKKSLSTVRSSIKLGNEGPISKIIPHKIINLQKKSINFKPVVLNKNKHNDPSEKTSNKVTIKKTRNFEN
ncbi:hypothetical protein SteCoe_33530 [Stentor coeruleus]|uniref:Uncharacterized protein n=1 Tax=Stentor coeruleus TaxID=5963 RepID=A0A1R2AWI1_9CILI|nr:hypothetical protein SteCoe_33530 [Stentor coeruleus]